MIIVIVVLAGLMGYALSLLVGNWLDGHMCVWCKAIVLWNSGRYAVCRNCHRRQRANSVVFFSRRGS